MARYKRYLDIDVVEAARQRIAHVHDIFDTVAVMFSGGKDSLVLLTLVYEYRAKHGPLPIDVIFLDEEVIPPQVVDTVQHIASLDWVRMHWMTVPLHNQKYVLGHTEDIVMWDPDRPHVRPMPQWGIKGEPGKVYRQHEMDTFTYNRLGFKGKTAYMVGIRASESLIRFRSVVNKLNENYICASTDKRVMLAKPIYDFLDNDVYKFCYEQDLPLSEVYRAQWLSQDRMRVATPLHAEARKQNKIYQWSPEFVEQIRRVFPDFDTQHRYERQTDVKQRIRPYLEEGMEGAKRYIDDHFPDVRQHAQAIKQFNVYRTLHKKDPLAYPAEHFLKQISTGVVRKMVLGVKK